MQSDLSRPSVSKSAFWIGWILSLLPALLLLFSAIMKLINPPNMAAGVAHLGLPMSLMFGLGVLELLCVIIYLVPATAVLGAILITGLMGGAVATCLRVGDSYYMQILLGVFAWAGVFLREPRLRALMPLRK